VVLGGGFAGVNFVERLANDERFFITLVDRNNFHSFAPLLYLRNHLPLNMEEAARTEDAEERSTLLNEGNCRRRSYRRRGCRHTAEMAHHIAPKEYCEISRVANPIYLIEAAPVLLGPMSKKSQQEATRVLTNLGVQIKLNVAVKDYADGKVILWNRETIATNGLIWTSGVIGKEVPGLPANVIGRGRRIIVDAYNSVEGTANVFAMGDICLQTTDKSYPAGHPQVAIQQGKNLADNFKRQVEGKPLRPFVYSNKGSMAIISKYKAVVDLPKSFVKGFVAWLMWLFVHLIPITSFRNKVRVSSSWVWSFITNDRTLRLIIRPNTAEHKR
jgi:NADH dehydrogenase